MAGIGDVAEAVFPPTQYVYTHRAEFLVQVIANRAIEDRMRLGLGLEEKRNILKAQLFDLPQHGQGAARVELLHPALQGAEHLRIRPQSLIGDPGYFSFPTSRSEERRVGKALGST